MSTEQPSPRTDRPAAPFSDSAAAREAEEERADVREDRRRQRELDEGELGGES